MGVNLKDLLIRHPIKLEQLTGKTLIVDGYNMLYQFLSTIRARDGNLLTNSKGQVTSHIIGLFSRTTNLMQKGIKLAFVFDGQPPKLKHKELQKRAELKKEAQQKYEQALETEDKDTMLKYASRTSKLTKDMVEQAKKLLDTLGIPHIQAPSEGEAQASHIVKKGQAYAVASQDYDSLIYGTPHLIQNLSIEGKRKLPGKFAYTTIEPKLTNLQENLTHLGLTQDQLMWLAILVGTDYAPAGAKGIGPKKGLAIVKKAKTPEEAFKDQELEEDWQEIINTFKTMPVTDDYKLEWKPVNRKEATRYLVEEQNFSTERVEKTLDQIAPQKQQKGLGDYT